MREGISFLANHPPKGKKQHKTEQKSANNNNNNFHESNAHKIYHECV